MTESEWLACDDWKPMLADLPDRAGHRGWGLYLAAGLRSLWDLLYADSSREAVEMVEKYADGKATKDEVWGVVRGAECPTFGYDFVVEIVREWRDGEFGLGPTVLRLIEMGIYSAEDIDRDEPLGDYATTERLRNAAHIAYHSLLMTDEGPNDHLEERLAAEPEWPGGWLVREIFGNPFRHAPPEADWRTAECVVLAQEIYENRTFSLLPALADLLDSAGCPEADLLAHLRGAGPHVPGCWALDRVRGVEEANPSPPSNALTPHPSPPPSSPG